MRLRHLRQVAGLTQSELSTRSGVHQAHISRIETGVYRRPSLHVVSRLASALGTSIDELAAPAPDTTDVSPEVTS